MAEIFGFLASIISLISFLMNDVKSIRIINISSAILFLVYAILIDSISLILLNSLLIIIHSIYLLKKEKKK